MKHTILIVDDEEDMRKVLQDALVEDYHVVEAGDGHYGLSEVLVGERNIDLVITDLKMPGSDGIELIENLPEETPVIVMSGYLSTPEFQDALKHFHPAAVFEKPFQISALFQAIHRALGQ